MTHCHSNLLRGLAIVGLLGVLGVPCAHAQTMAQMLPAAPVFPDPALQPGYQRSPDTTALNRSMLEQIERNPGAPMAATPFTVQPGATVTYPPQVQAPYPQLMPQPQR